MLAGELLWFDPLRDHMLGPKFQPGTNCFFQDVYFAEVFIMRHS